LEIYPEASPSQAINGIQQVYMGKSPRKPTMKGWRMCNTHKRGKRVGGCPHRWMINHLNIPQTHLKLTSSSMAAETEKQARKERTQTEQQARKERTQSGPPQEQS
jgi:hypothetical protein